MIYGKSQGKSVPSVSNTLLAQNQLRCRNYSCNKFLTLVVPKNPTYNAALEWEQCTHFVQWLQKPANQDKKSIQLSQQKEKFLTSLHFKRSLSPRQQEVLTGIEAKVGGNANASD
jgi:hypothetical protein